MKIRYLLMIPWLLLSAVSAAAQQGHCFGCSGQHSVTQGHGATSSGTGGPRRGAALTADLAYCQTNATYCLVANASARKLSLFQNDRGVISWDIIMQDPGRTLRGHISQVILDPDWCPTASVRRKFPGLPAGCLEAGHPQNAMGDVKITMTGSFAGTAIRIHDTPGFGTQWPNEDSSGCVRVLNLRRELLPRIQGGRVPVEVVFHS